MERDAESSPGWGLTCTGTHSWVLSCMLCPICDVACLGLGSQGLNYVVGKDCVCPSLFPTCLSHWARKGHPPPLSKESAFPGSRLPSFTFPCLLTVGEDPWGLVLEAPLHTQKSDREKSARSRHLGPRGFRYQMQAH